MILRLLVSSGVRRVLSLVFRLLRDDRVPLAVKLIVPAVVVYIISPVDFLPEILPVLGLLDDVVVLLVGTAVFLLAVPRRILVEHLHGGGSRHVRNRSSEDDVIEGKYRFDDDERPSSP